MTCVVGLEHDGRVYMGADSAAVNERTEIIVRRDSKIFQNGPMLIAYSSSYRLGQLLRFELTVPKQPKGMEDFAYLTTLFMAAVRDCLDTGGCLISEGGAESIPGCFLLAYNGMLWQVESDLQVGSGAYGYDAAGAGRDIALGAMYATRRWRNPEKRIVAALEAAETFNACVRGPFLVTSV